MPSPGTGRTAVPHTAARSALPGTRGLRCGHRERTQRAPQGPAPNPEPDEGLLLPDTPLCGTVRAQAWHFVHPLVHGDRGWFAGRKHLPVLRGILVHPTVERLPDGRDPHRAMWMWHAGPGPLSLDELWRAYLARFGIEHVFILKGTLGLTAARLLGPEPADRWVRIVMAAHAQLLLARPLAADLRRPWEKQPDPARHLRPGGSAGVSQHPLRARHPRPCRDTLPPRPGRPKGSSKGPAPRYRSPAKPPSHAKQTRTDQAKGQDCITCSGPS